MIAISDKIIEFGLIFLILLTPLAFGSVYVWAYSIMELTVFSLLITMVLKKGLIQRGKFSFPFFFPVIGFLALILLQMTPLPPRAMKLLSPKTYDLYSLTIDGYPKRMGEDIGERGIIRGKEITKHEYEAGNQISIRESKESHFENWRTLSVYPHATLTGLIKIISYLGVFLLIINYVDSKRKLMRISTIIVSSGILVALLGIAQKVAEAPKIYWFWEPLFKKDASFFGPFVNPNHFAGYIEMVIPLSIGLFVSRWSYLGRGRLHGIREFVIKIASEDGCKLILFSFFIVLMVGALFLSSSRAGVISFLGSMIFLLLTVTKREKGRHNTLLVLGLLVSVFFLLTWMGIRPLVEEINSVQALSQDYDIQYRFQNWKDAGVMVRDFPVFGTGLGTFAAIFPKYKTTNLQYHYLYLENDYLQLLCEMGIFGFGVFSWFMLSFFQRAGSGGPRYESNKTGNSHYIYFYGCLSGLVAIMIHSFWDFNMHIPSNALLLNIIMGLAIAGRNIWVKERSRYLRGTHLRDRISG